MADSENGNSSTGKDKGKTPMLDDDTPKYFFGSWKSMFMSGGDAMDFNFEPVAEGNKKTFDFGKLGMDFTLGGDFRKMSSFKIDMPDLDFSNSPKKSTKSKETAEMETSKGRVASNNNDFNLSFDFNGMDDFSLDGPSTKGAKSPSREKSSKEVGSSKEMECEDLPRQVDHDNGKADENTTGKTPRISENATNSISEVLIDTEKKIDTSFSMEKMTVKGTDEEVHTEKGGPTQSYTEPKVKNISSNSLLVKTPVVSTTSEELENSSLNEKQNDISGAFTLSGQLLAAAGEKLKPDKLSPECSTDKMNVDCGGNKTLVDGNESTGKLTSDSMNPSVTNASEVLPSEIRSKVETQKSASKFFASPFGRSTLAKATVLAYKVPRSNNPKYPRVDNTKQGVMVSHSVMESEDKGSAHLSPAGDRNENDGKKVDSISISSTKELVNPDSVMKTSEKNADVDTLSSKEGMNNMELKTHCETSFDMVPQDRQTMTDENFVLGNENKIEDVKSSRLCSFAVPPHFLSRQESKFGKQISTKIKDKMPGIESTQKSNISEMNKLPPLIIGKKLSGLPVSKISPNVAMNKHSASPVAENAKSMGTLRNRFQAKIKSSPTTAPGKPRTSPSLKRKPSEGADEGSRNPHPLKRLSPGYSRMCKELSPGNAKEEVHTKGSLLDGRAKNANVDHSATKFDFHLETSMEDFSLTSVLESDANVEKAEACAKELEDICNMLKKKHEEANELLVRALVNNNNILMLNHPIYEDKIRAVQRFADRLMPKELKA